MTTLNIPYEPIRKALYSPGDLYGAFDENDFRSWTRTVDFEIYRHFVVEGRSSPSNPYTGMMQALHDSTITQHTASRISKRRVSAIMGGHTMQRGTEQYISVALLARRLSQGGVLMCSGGGPGAMEACHLGAAMAQFSEKELRFEISTLSDEAAMPTGIESVVAADGEIDEALAANAHKWFLPAYRIWKHLGDSAGESLALPTWHYGHESTTPFATHIAKYFQNSIREHGLLALAKNGVVYSEGKAGTLQEIFQDAAQNYYKAFDTFSPMVFLGVNYWTVQLPIIAVLEKLFCPGDFRNYVLVTDDINAAGKFLEDFAP